MIEFGEIEEALLGHSVITGLKVLPKSHVRIATKLLYPDGSGISLYFERGDLARPEGYAISDFGQTFAKLGEFQIALPSRARSIDEIVTDIGARVFDDRIVLELSTLDQLGDGVIQLGQACIRVSCLIFGRRSPQQARVNKAVQAVVSGTGLQYEPNYRFRGPYREDVKVDYRVTGPAKKSSILVLGSSHAQANEIFRKWSDLKTAAVQDRFVTIYDEDKGVERDDDLVRIEKMSDVVSVKNRAGIEQILKAA